MNPMFVLVSMLSYPPASSYPPMSGARLFFGSSCYVTTNRGQASPENSLVLRRVRRGDRPGEVVVTIASRVGDAPISRSELRLRPYDLLPISVEEREGDRLRSRTVYEEGRANSTDFPDARPPTTRSIETTGFVWDDESAEFVITTIQFPYVAHYEFPVFNVQRGPATARLDLRGSRLIEVDGRMVDAWVIDGTTRSARVFTYYVAKSDRRLLGLDSDSFSSRLGGDCSALEQGQ